MGTGPAVTEFNQVTLTVARVAFPLIARRPRPAVLDPAVRAAMIVDLVLGGAIVRTDDDLEVYVAPTGFGPTDRLLQAVDAQPDKSLTHWIFRGPVGVKDVAAEFVAAGEWKITGLMARLRDTAPDDRAAVVASLATKDGVPARACAAELLEQLGVPEVRRHHERSATEFGTAFWLVPELAEKIFEFRMNVGGEVRGVASSGF